MLNRKNERKFRSHQNRLAFLVDAPKNSFDTPEDRERRIERMERRHSQGCDLFTGEALQGHEWASWLELYYTGRELEPIMEGE